MSKFFGGGRIAVALLIGASGLLSGTAVFAASGADDDLKKATAIAIGNIAWESVVVKQVKRGPTVTWVAETWGTGIWHCTVKADGKFPYCELQGKEKS